jgi:hypothetical protein
VKRIGVTVNSVSRALMAGSIDPALISRLHPSISNYEYISRPIHRLETLPG